MREELKNIFTKQVMLEDGSQYFYRIQPFEMKNRLDTVVAVLDEYVFTKKDSSESYKLYRTKDGNWYDVNEEISTQAMKVLRELKLSFDKLSLSGKL